MSPTTKLFESQARFIKGACRRMMDEFPKDRERLPQGERFESKDDFHICSICHILYQRKVLTQEVFLHDVTGIGEFTVVYHNTLNLAKRNNNCLVPALRNSMVALALSPVPSTFFTSPMPKRSCCMSCPT